MKLVIKIGTSTLAYPTGRMNLREMEKFCRIVSDIKNAGHEVVLVSSGAIGMGVGKLSLKDRPSDMPTKQAAAAVGQCELMYVYDKLFAEHNHVVAQILMTGDDFANAQRHANFRNTARRLLEMDVLPIVNENDTVATEEIAVGGNDILSAIVATSIGADLLILLSDIDGLYTTDPHKCADARRIDRIDDITDSVMALGGGIGSALGTGGMKTKLEAAKICTQAGCDMIITNGAFPERLYDILEGKSVGTFFAAKNKGENA